MKVGDIIVCINGDSDPNFIKKGTIGILKKIDGKNIGRIDCRKYRNTLPNKNCIIADAINIYFSDFRLYSKMKRKLYE